MSLFTKAMEEFYPPQPPVTQQPPAKRQKVSFSPSFLHRAMIDDEKELYIALIYVHSHIIPHTQDRYYKEEDNRKEGKEEAQS